MLPKMVAHFISGMAAMQFLMMLEISQMISKPRRETALVQSTVKNYEATRDQLNRIYTTKNYRRERTLSFFAKIAKAGLFIEITVGILYCIFAFKILKKRQNGGPNFKLSYLEL